MKITINGNITPETVETYLDKQYQKKEKIIAYCKNKKITELQYKDSELEFEFKQDLKVETRPKVATTKETRKGV